MEKSFSDVCRDAREYCNNHFKFDRGFEDVHAARNECEEVNAEWQDMFDAYVAKWEDPA